MSFIKREQPSRVGMTSDQLSIPLIDHMDQESSIDRKDLTVNQSSFVSHNGAMRSPRGTKETGSFVGDPDAIEERPHEENNQSAASIRDSKKAQSNPNGPLVFIDPADDIPNNTDKCIDFAAQLQAHKKRTEADLPYTLTQVEDAMFLDYQNVMTLEFHYYQDDCQYTYLDQCEEHLNAQGKLVDADGEKVEHLLGTESYMDDTCGIPHPMNAFEREDIQNYVDSHEDIVKHQRSLSKHERSFESVVDANAMVKADLAKKIGSMMSGKKKGRSQKRKAEPEYQMIEGIICLYKINNLGGMQRHSQTEIKMGRKFFPAMTGNMELTRSKDKKVVSLTNFDRNDQSGDYFKIKAWTSKLAVFWGPSKDNFYSLQNGINQYFAMNKSTFSELIQVSFVGNSKYVQLIYMEAVERDLPQQQQYELEMERLINERLDGIAELTGVEATPRSVGNLSAGNRDSLRKGRKYVFFDIENGELVFEYGGIQTPSNFKTQNGQEVPIYELGCLVKEIREENFDPKLVFYFAGDFMDPTIKKYNMIMKWAMNYSTINMIDLFQLGSQQEKMEFIHQKMGEIINSPILDGHLNYFPFDNNFIEKQIFNWEQNIHVKSNRKFDQIVVLNQPIDKEEYSTNSIYIHGQKFKDLLNLEKLRQTSYIFELPYFRKLADDGQYRISRNANIKDQIYYDQIKNNVMKTFCVRPDEPSRILCCPDIKIGNYVSQHDIWLQCKKNFETGVIEDIFQTIHVTAGNQFGKLQTELPLSMKSMNSSDKDMVIERRTSTFYQNQADLPCIAYNLGDNQICIQNTYQMQQKKSYIIKLGPDEKFVSWLNFNQFQDIGFYPEGIRIECCSHFAYLTTGKGPNSTEKSNQINIIFVDPFYIETQVARFKSSTFYDNDIFSECDTMVKTCVQSTMGQKRSKSFKTYLWTQYPQGLVRSKLLRGEGAQVRDSDESDEGSQEDESDVVGKIYQEQVQMLQDQSDFIYYIIKQNGMCDIIEGNPRDPYQKNHTSIYSIKADKCLAFSQDSLSDVFYFMDQDYVVTHLARNTSNRGLSPVGYLTMKEIQTLDFNPRDFDPTLMNEKYVVQGNKIFYFYDNQEEPFPEGILESEDIVVEKRGQPLSKPIQGPIAINGSFRYFNVYQVDKFKSHITVALKPDSTSRVIINDYLNFVDMSTFLEDGKILIKIRRRYMVFTCNGAFIDEAQFDDAIMDQQDQYSELEEQTLANTNIFSARHYEIEKNGQEKLRERRKLDPITDFDGNEYQFAPEMKPVPLSESNKLDILNMSYNNKWWLFYNRIKEQFYLYKFVVEDKDFKFELKHKLNIDDSFLFNHMSKLGVDPIAYFRSNLSQIKVSDEGSIKLCYVENLPIADVKDIDSDDSQNEISSVQCRLVGSIFTVKEGQFQTTCQSFMNMFEMPRDAQNDMAVIIEGKKQLYDRKISQNCKIQQRKPQAHRDYVEFENMIDDLTLLEGKNSNVVYAKVFYDNLIVIYCGKYVKYGWLMPNTKKTKKSQTDIMDLVLVQKKKEVLQSMNVYFAESIEVIKLVETDINNTVQVVTIDHNEGIFTILTWNFNENIEKNCKQTRPDPNDKVGYHVVKGMNLKINYLLNQHHLIDLENNIPLRQTKVNQKLDTACVNYNMQLKMSGDLFNQRKIFQDGMKFLGVEKASCLFYPLCRMDLILWRDIHNLGERAELIEQSCTVEDCNIVIDGISLFHYFAENSELIEAMHSLYQTKKDNGTLMVSNETMPLQCLNPDHEGKSALYRAIASQSPASFECMIMMIIEFPEYSISKMVLKSFALILAHESDDVIDFFESNIYQPPQMQEEQFVPGWTEDMEMFVFPSHTSVISKRFLIEEMGKQGIDVGGPVKGAIKVKEEKPTLTSKELKAEIIVKKKNLKAYTLEATFDAGLPEGEKPLKRVQLEALDFDWIFDENNAKVLLGLLATEANNNALTKKSIKIFIDLMWSKFQPAIILYMFVPYSIMLVNLCILASGGTGTFINLIKQYNKSVDTTEDPPVTFSDAQMQELNFVKLQTYVNLVLAVVLWMFFSSIELPQLFSDPADYFSDVWNWIDTVSIIFNGIFLTICTTCIVTENTLYFDLTQLRSYGAFACFFMWIKVFYWMRLFSSLAYFVKLIMQTFSDSIPFMTMVIIIILAFANYFYVIQNNLNEAVEYCTRDSNTEEAIEACEASYFGEYYSSPIGDTLVSTYLLGALGDFDSELYPQGPDAKAAMGMFLLATFIIAVVFMNMLIAIMGETFGQVQEAAVESGLRERVVLISDHAWLLNLKKIFKGKKYIIIITPSIGSDSNSDPLIDSVKDSEVALRDRMTKLQASVSKKIANVDVNTKFLLNSQKTSVQSIIRKVKTFNKLYTETKAEEKESEEMSLEERQEKKLRTQKMAEIMKNLNKQTSSQKLSVSTIKQVAQDWLEIADKDGNGTLDLQEFQIFFSKIEGIPLNQQEINNIFHEYDLTGDNQLSVEEFARAIYNVLLADQEDYSDDEDEDHEASHLH